MIAWVFVIDEIYITSFPSLFFRTTLQFSESTVSDNSPPESVNLSREESYLSLEPLYFNSISRSSSERSGTGMRDVLVSPLGEATEFLPLKVIAPEMVADIHELLTPIFEDYHSVMVSGLHTVEDCVRLGNRDLDFEFRICNRTRNPKTDFNGEISIFGFSLLPFDWEIRKRI